MHKSIVTNIWPPKKSKRTQKLPLFLKRLHLFMLALNCN